VTPRDEFDLQRKIYLILDNLCGAQDYATQWRIIAEQEKNPPDGSTASHAGHAAKDLEECKRRALAEIVRLASPEKKP
jgi:hypothetical protein